MGTTQTPEGIMVGQMGITQTPQGIMISQDGYNPNTQRNHGWPDGFNPTPQGIMIHQDGYNPNTPRDHHGWPTYMGIIQTSQQGIDCLALPLILVIDTP
jgi:hypothetical protein